MEHEVFGADIAHGIASKNGQSPQRDLSSSFAENRELPYHRTSSNSVHTVWSPVTREGPPDPGSLVQLVVPRGGFVGGANGEHRAV